MRSLKKQRRIQVIVIALVCLAGATWLIGYALRDGINLFRSPSEVNAQVIHPNEVFRLGGLVLENSILPGTGVQFEFIITDRAESVRVRYVGDNLPPDLFEEGQGTIATGRLVEGVFLATEILAKHDETYMSKEVIETLKEQGVYQDPNG